MLEVITRNERDNQNGYNYWVVEIQDRDLHGPVKNSMRIEYTGRGFRDRISIINKNERAQIQGERNVYSKRGLRKNRGANFPALLRNRTRLH